MIDIIIDANEKDKRNIHKMISNCITQLNIEEISNLDTIYVMDKRKRMELFKGISLPLDPIYIRKGKTGNPCIILSTEYLFKEKRKKMLKILYNILWIQIIIILSVPLFIWGILDRNMKVWYLWGEINIKKKYIIGVNSRIEFRLVNSLLFQIGISRIFDKYCSGLYCQNINAFEYATKFRNHKIKTYSWLNIQ